MKHGAAPHVSLRQRLLGGVGVAVHLVVGYFYRAIGLVVPPVWVGIFMGIWAILLIAGIWMLIRRPLLALLVPVLALAILIGGVVLGGALLGWQA